MARHQRRQNISFFLINLDNNYICIEHYCFQKQPFNNYLFCLTEEVKKASSTTIVLKRKDGRCGMFCRDHKAPLNESRQKVIQINKFIKPIRKKVPL